MKVRVQDDSLTQWAMHFTINLFSDESPGRHKAKSLTESTKFIFQAMLVVTRQFLTPAPKHRSSSSEGPEALCTVLALLKWQRHWQQLLFVSVEEQEQTRTGLAVWTCINSPQCVNVKRTCRAYPQPWWTCLYPSPLPNDWQEIDVTCLV